MGLNVPAVPTCDVCDAMGAAAIVVPIDMRDFGGRVDFCGPVLTLHTENDNTKVRTAVESAGEGRVLVVDNGGRTERALVGGNLAALAAKNG